MTARLNLRSIKQVWPCLVLWCTALCGETASSQTHFWFNCSTTPQQGTTRHLCYAARGPEFCARAPAWRNSGAIRSGCLMALDQLTELIEERRRIVRAWGCFGMVLDTVDWLGFVAHAFHSLIV